MINLQYIFKGSNSLILILTLLVMCGCSVSPSYIDTDLQNQQFLENGTDVASEIRLAGQNEKNQNWLSQDGKIVYLYLVLNDALINGDADTALNCIQELILLAPTEELFSEAVSIYDFNGNNALALTAAQAGAELYPLDLTLHMMLSELLARNNQVDEAIKHLTTFSAEYDKNKKGLSYKQKQKDVSEMRLLLIRLLMNDQRYKAARSEIAAIPSREQTATILFYEAQIYKATGHTDEALRKLEILVKKHPNFTEAWMAMAAEAEQGKQYKTAASYYKKALSTNDLPQIYLMMLNAQLSAGQNKTDVRQLINSGYTPDILLQAAQILMKHGRFKPAKEVLLSLEHTPFIKDEVNYFLALLAHDSGEDYEEALERLEQLSTDIPNRAMALHLKIEIFVKTKNLEKAIETTEILVDEFPTVKNNWLLLSELHNAVKNYNMAASIAEKALEQWPDDYQLTYGLGANLGFQNKTEESMQIMELLLSKNPNDAFVLNFAGYMLADNNMELERARDMLSKAMKLEPKSYHIVDSMAWVQYRLHDYNNAWNNIRRCIKMGADDAVVWEHYGDIAVALGKKKDALEAYKKAIKLEHEDIQAVLKKIQLLEDQ